MDTQTNKRMIEQGNKTADHCCGFSRALADTWWQVNLAEAMWQS